MSNNNLSPIFIDIPSNLGFLMPVSDPPDDVETGRWI